MKSLSSGLFFGGDLRTECNTSTHYSAEITEVASWSNFANMSSKWASILVLSISGKVEIEFIVSKFILSEDWVILLRRQVQRSSYSELHSIIDHEK